MMGKNDIMNAIRSLAGSQGFYGRILSDLNDMAKEDREKVLDTLEAQNFNDTVDMVLWFES